MINETIFTQISSYASFMPYSAIAVQRDAFLAYHEFRMQRSQYLKELIY